VQVPAIDAVVGGDVVVYNQVHNMMGETDHQSSEAWIGSLDRIAALNPKIVVGPPAGRCSQRSEDDR
jgi:hypothetical protein